LIENAKDGHAVNGNDMASNKSNHGRDVRAPVMKKSMLTRLLVTGVALSVAAAHLIWPHLKLDSIIVALLVVALLPWLGAVFESLELPGGWKVQYREIQRQLTETQTKTQQATGAAASASQKAELALATNESDDRAGKAEQLNELVDEYNKTRVSQQSGYPRTTILTQIAGRMVSLSRKLPNYDWREALGSDDQGQRMAGYAWLYARPNPAAVEFLVHTLTIREDSHFGQYWAIQALQRSLPLANPETVGMVIPKLRAFLSRLPADSDRSYELSKLLNQLAGAPDS
jgi:hypothetical protein